MSGYPLLEVGTPPPYNEQVIGARLPYPKTKTYLVHLPITRNIISSYDVVFEENISSALAYTPQLYSEAMAMHPAVTYTPYATSSKIMLKFHVYRVLGKFGL